MGELHRNKSVLMILVEQAAFDLKNFLLFAPVQCILRRLPKKLPVPNAAEKIPHPLGWRQNLNHPPKRLMPHWRSGHPSRIHSFHWSQPYPILKRKGPPHRPGTCRKYRLPVLFPGGTADIPLFPTLDVRQISHIVPGQSPIANAQSSAPLKKPLQSWESDVS